MNVNGACLVEIKFSNESLVCWYVGATFNVSMSYLNIPQFQP